MAARAGGGVVTKLNTELAKIFGVKALEDRVYTITPQIASRLLSRNTKNRRLNKTRVRHLARDLQQGSWQYNGETIKLSTSGRILDGQHRLTACSESGVAIKTMVIFGLPDDAFHTIDVGTKRNISDTLLLEGEKHTILLGASLRLLSCFRKDGHLDNLRKHHPTLQEMLHQLELEPRIRDSIDWVAAQQTFTNKDKLCAPSPLAFMHYAATRQNKSLADPFFEKMITGLDIKSREPVGLLRNYLVRRARNAGIEGHADPTRVWLLSVLIEAWTATRDGQKMDKLYYASYDFWKKHESPRLGTVRK